MAVAVFDPAAWKARFAAFGAVSDQLAALFFDEATLYLDNSDCSPVQDVGRRLILLNLLTAHIASLAGADTPDGVPSGVVGRVASATEGAVSVSSQLDIQNGSAAWYAQTTYGLSFWQATKRYRSATYVASPQRSFEPRGVPWQT